MFDGGEGHRCKGCVLDGPMYADECRTCRRYLNPWFGSVKEPSDARKLEDKYELASTISFGTKRILQ